MSDTGDPIPERLHSQARRHADAPPPRRERTSILTLLFILVGNLIPIAGVVWWGWDASQVLVLYWIETFVVGVATFERVRTAQGGGPRPRVHFSDTEQGFFLIHYGVFWLVHGVFVFVLLLIFSGGDVLGLWRLTFGSGGFWLAAAGMALSHAVVFWREWVRPRAWRTADPGKELFRPYGRVFAQHFMVILGFWVLEASGGAAGLIVLLCGMKTVVDLVIEVIPHRPARG